MAVDAVSLVWLHHVGIAAVKIRDGLHGCPAQRAALLLRQEPHAGVAEIAGRVGTETTRRAAALTDSTGLDPAIRWSTTGRIQLNDEVTVTLTLETDIGLFGGFGSFPITLTASATGKSEGYWK